MATIPNKISYLQDVIQEKLTSASVEETVQDKVGNFSLFLINGNLPLAKNLLMDEMVISAICLVERELEELCHCSRIFLGKAKEDSKMISLRELFPEFSKPKAIMQGEIAFQKEKSQCSPDEKEKLYEDSQRQSSSNAIEDITSKLCEGKTTQDDDLGGTILDSSATGKDVKKDCEDQFDEKEEEEIEDGEDGEKEKGEGNEMDLSDLMMTIKM